jgi:methylmalonyl-CoA mutase
MKKAVFDQLTFQKDLKTTTEAVSTYQTAENISLKSFFSPADLNDQNYSGYVSGIAPFLRGPYSSMYAVKPWTIRQYAGFSTADFFPAVMKRFTNNLLKKNLI